MQVMECLWRPGRLVFHSSEDPWTLGIKVQVIQDPQGQAQAWVTHVPQALMERDSEIPVQADAKSNLQAAQCSQNTRATGLTQVSQDAQNGAMQGSRLNQEAALGKGCTRHSAESSTGWG